MTLPCPCCDLEAADAQELADHFLDLAEASDVAHVMWLNRAVSMKRLPRDELARRLGEVVGVEGQDPAVTG